MGRFVHFDPFQIGTQSTQFVKAESDRHPLELRGGDTLSAGIGPDFGLRCSAIGSAYTG